MARNLGIHIHETATSANEPATADVGIPFVVGTAPIHTANVPAKVNVPVLCRSWNDAVEHLGFSFDWKSYSLCEFMYSHFQLYGCQPVVFCNVLDPEKDEMTDKNAGSGQEPIQIAEHQAILPFSAVSCTIQVSVTTDFGEALKRDVDYSIFYDENACVVELLETSEHYNVQQLYIKYEAVKPDAVGKVDIIDALNSIDYSMSIVGVVPDLICAPGWSHDRAVAAVMATKAESINGLFRAKALIDISTDSVRKYSDLVTAKNEGRIVDENQIACWPMVTADGYMFHMSTHLAGLMAQVDMSNGGVPYESPSNKNFKIDGCCLADGTEVNLSFDQVNLIVDWGIVTTMNFLSLGWIAKGNYTACYPSNTDVKDQFIPVSRMFDYVSNTLIRTFWSKLDKPMNLRLLDNIQDTCNIWLNGLVSQEYLLGARVELRTTENPVSNLLAGIISANIYLTPPIPAQEFNFSLEFNVDDLANALNWAG